MEWYLDLFILDVRPTKEEGRFLKVAVVLVLVLQTMRSVASRTPIVMVKRCLPPEHMATVDMGGWGNKVASR